MSKSKLFFHIVMSAVLAGCAFSKDSDAGKTKQTNITINRDAEHVAYSQDLIKSSAVPDQNLHQYKGRIQWPPLDNTTFQISDIGPQTASIATQIQEVNGNAGLFEFLLPEGHRQTLQLDIFNSIGGHVLTKVINIEAPIDMEIYDKVSFDRDKSLKVGRILFHRNAQIDTKYHSLEIEADNLIAEEGTSIVTLSKDDIDPASPGNIDTSALPAPHFAIHAKGAIGHLEVKMIGYNGREGLPGDDIPADIALNGIKGNDSRIAPACVGGPYSYVCLGIHHNVPYDCSIAPTNGGDAMNGRDGKPGGRGQNGGDTGSLDLQIANSNSFNVTVTAIPGIGGRGGRGGKGQPGGTGGEAGLHVTHDTVCPDAKAGLNGHPGKSGPEGPSGDRGNVENINIVGVKYFRSADSANFEATSIGNLSK